MHLLIRIVSNMFFSYVWRIMLLHIDMNVNYSILLLVMCITPPHYDVMMTSQHQLAGYSVHLAYYHCSSITTPWLPPSAVKYLTSFLFLTVVIHHIYLEWSKAYRQNTCDNTYHQNIYVQHFQHSPPVLCILSDWSAASYDVIMASCLVHTTPKCIIHLQCC